MKKIAILMAIIMIFLVGCVNYKEESKTNTELSNSTEITSNDVENQTEPEIDKKVFLTNKTYYYVVSNELLATSKNGEIKDKAESSLTLDDIFADDQYIEYSDIFSGNEHQNHDEIAVCTYYSEGTKVNEADFNKIINALNSGDLVSVKEKESDNWFDYRDIYSYKLNNRTFQDNNLDIKDLLKVYGGTINFGNNFVTNNDTLEFVIPNYSNDISPKAKEVVEAFISQHNLDVPSYEIKNYSLDIDGDSNNENLYIVENPIRRDSNGYFDGNKQFTESSKISLCFIEDDGAIISICSYLMNKYDSEEDFTNKYWEEESAFSDGIKVSFADFDGDSNLELLLKREVVAIEPFDVYELIDYSNGAMNVVAIHEGTNH